MDTRVSIILPYHDMDNGAFFLKRAIDSIMSQTYKNYEIVLTKDGKAAENTNSGIKRATGDLVKILCMDDYFTNENALQAIVDAFNGTWLINGVSDNTNPIYTGDIHLGDNRLGGLSSIAFKKECFVPFDESLVWLFDCVYV